MTAAAACLFALLAPPTSDPLPAFPGAEGFGAFASGGRGGDVYHVTTLNDSGMGSFRDAVSKGRRIVVFDVGGYIELKAPVTVASDITLAGQTAPGDGIGIKNYEVSFAKSSNVIARYVRFRQGATRGQEKKSAVSLAGARNIILDHVSIQFGRQSNLDLTGCKDVTIQYSILGDANLPLRAGCLGEGDNITFSHNLWINNQTKNPWVRGGVQFINNVVYNWQTDAFTEGGDKDHETWDDIVGNYFIKGPATGDRGPFAGGNDKARVYAFRNYLDDNRNGKLDGRLIPDADLGPVKLLKKPTGSAKVTIDSAVEAYRKVVAEAGCSLRRDAVDNSVLDDLTSLGRRGRIIASPAEVGGFGIIKGGLPPKDSDCDGIPDSWESSHDLDPFDPADRNKLDKSGYTMLEVYLNSLVEKKPPTGTFTLKVTPPTLSLKPGTRATVTVTATRTDYTNPIDASLENLPGRVTAPLATIPRGQTSVQVVVTADAAARGQRSDVRLRATLATDGVEQVLSPNFTIRLQPASVPASFRLKVGAGTVRLRQGSKARLRVSAERKNYTGPITVELRNLPGQVTASRGTIAPGSNVVDIDITAAGNARPGNKGGVYAHGTGANIGGDSPPFGISVKKK
jgi:pectate lyase